MCKHQFVGMQVSPTRCRMPSIGKVSATATSAGQTTSGNTAGIVEALHQAAADRSISPKQLCAAMTQIEKRKLPADGWSQQIGGTKSPGRRWQLVFTSGTKQVQDALKTGKGGGFYFPVNAVQRFDTEAQVIENGIYLGHILSFAFLGPWAMKARKLDFDFDRINVKLGPWKFGFPLQSSKKKAEEGGKKDSGPFFLFCYVDDQVAVARGRGGGLALWRRTNPVWEVEAGITQF